MPDLTILSARQAVAKCREQWANPDGAVPKRPRPSEPPADADPLTQALWNVSLPGPRNFEPKVMDRLREWLNQLANQAEGEGPKGNASTAYGALLQVWLHAHDIACPPGVFKTNLAGARRGRPRSPRGRAQADSCRQLKESGLTWSKVAERVFPDRFAVNRRKAAEHARYIAEQQSIVIPTSDGIDDLYDDVGYLLAIQDPDPTDVL